MGFASYFEDIQQAKDDLRFQLGDFTTGAPHRSPTMPTERTRGLLRAAERLVDTIDTRIEYYLSLATDPSIDLVDQLDELQRRRTILESEVDRARASVEALQVREEELRSQIARLKAERDAARKEARRSERSFEEVMRLNPDAVYDRYSTPELMRRHKPEDA